MNRVSLARAVWTKWDELNNNPDKPMYNRVRETWAPGSSFKPVTGAVGLTTGRLRQRKISAPADYPGRKMKAGEIIR